MAVLPVSAPNRAGGEPPTTDLLNAMGRKKVPSRRMSARIAFKRKYKGFLFRRLAVWLSWRGIYRRSDFFELFGASVSDVDGKHLGHLFGFRVFGG